MWLALNCAHPGKGAEMHLEAYSFSQWVLELWEGGKLLGTSLAGLVLLQPVLSMTCVWLTLPASFCLFPI